MAWLLSGFGVAVSLGFVIAGALMNWRYGLGIGRTVEDQLLNAAVHLLIDCSKVMMPFFMWWAWRERRWIVAGGAALVTVASISYSAIGIAGYVNLSWSLASGALVGKRDQLADWQAELVRSQQRITAIGITMTTSVIDRELERLRQSSRWLTSNKCTQATTAASREFCIEYKNFQTDKAKAEAAATLEGRIAELRGKIDALSGIAGVDTIAGGDPRADMVVRITGWQLSLARTVLAVMFVGIVESMATFGVFLSLNHGELARVWNAQADAGTDALQTTKVSTSMTRPAEAGHDLPQLDAEPVAPLSLETVVRFVADATEPANADVDVEDLYGHYATWCQHVGCHAVGIATFEHAFDRLRLLPEVGQYISKSGTHYTGIAISSPTGKPRSRR